MKQRIKWKLQEWAWMFANVLSFCACKLRGHKFYDGWSWPGLYGNRPTVLEDRINISALLLTDLNDKNESEHFTDIQNAAAELAALAGGEFWHGKESRK